MAKVKMLKETPEQIGPDWTLCFQWSKYVYANKEVDFCYRFIWRKPYDGALQPARGQTRIPSMADMDNLIQLAEKAGWLKNVEKRQAIINWF